MRELPGETELLEELAELEHKQWLNVARAYYHEVSEERREKWRESECFRDYRDLTEEQKEDDRVWARRVIEIVKKHLIKEEEPLTTRKVIRSSNLALRFYIQDGWTEEELNNMCTQGCVFLRGFKESHDSSYYMLHFGKDSKFDLDKLDDKCLKLIRAFDDNPHESDKEYMSRFNGELI